MKKVLIITYYWPPSGGAGVQRFLKTTKYLPKMGIEPIVLTCKNPTYPIIDESLQNEIPSKIKVFKTRTIEPFGLFAGLTGKTKQEIASPVTVLGKKKKSIFQKIGTWIRANIFIPDARIGWRFISVRQALEIIDTFKIDTIISTGPPHSTHLLGKVLAEKRPIKWIADFRDPWVEIHYNKALPRTKFAVSFDSSIEKSVLDKADHITVTALGTKKILQNKTQTPISVITNGYDEDDFDSNNDYKNSIFTIRHVGSITETSVPYNLISALSNLKELDFKVEFIGYFHTELRDLVAHHNLQDKVFFEDYKPHREAAKLMQTADLNVVVVHRSDESDALVPGKLYDYLRAGKPILVLGPKNGDAAKIAIQSGLGIVFEHENINELQLKIYEMIQNPYEYSLNSGFIKSFSREALTQKFAKLIVDEH